MAGRWRIRHKLMLGLGLVVGILALLLTGTLKGLASYRATANSMDSKLAELHEAQKLRVVMMDLDVVDGGSTFSEEIARLRIKLQLARQTLAVYQERLEMTLLRRRDPDKGFKEKRHVEALEELFSKLEQGINEAAEVPVINQLDRAQSPRRHPKIDEAITRLIRTADDLQDVIYHDLSDRISTAKTDYKHALWIVGTTSVVGVALMVGLLRFFYGWVFYPIRDLERGVGRVAQGDFEHKIEVHSGDEIEDLAAAFNDMTGRLRDLYGDLTHQVNERSRQLVRSERLASVGFLAAGVAHEINNPLASIAFCAEALEARLASAARTSAPVASLALRQTRDSGQQATDEEVIAKYLKMIQDEAFRCKNITERLLEFSRPGDRHREPADLGELVQAVLNVLEHHQSSKGKQIILKPQGQVTARVNVQEIKSVILNLVVNALDSMEDGGALTIRMRQRDGMAELQFADTGCGMTGDVLENIFEPFFTRSRTGKGTGLGLTISHRIVAQHGGSMEATSAGAGQGSTFTVRLPMQPAEVGAKEETLAQAA